MELTRNTDVQISPGRRRLCMVEEERSSTGKCIKRRRRDPSTLALSCSTINDQSSDQQQKQPVGDRTATVATTVKRSSRFRGVSRHRWTGRFEAHLWDKGTWNPTQRKKGKQVYLGAYDEEESAARAYDLAALKYWPGTSTFTNFPVSDYEQEIEIMNTMSREEYLASLRRRSSGFSRGVSKYRGVARHHHNGRWEARIGRVFGNKYLYLGTYSTQEEAAHAYDIAAIEYRGINAVTNFDLSTYIRWLKPEASLPALDQEPKPTSDPLPPPMTTFSNHFPSEMPTQLPDLQTDPSLMNNLNTPKHEDIFHSNPVSPLTRSSSSTALSLLLKSSIFKDLVEKNLNTTFEENEENDTKNLPQNGNNNAGEAFYDGFSHIPLTGTSNEDSLLHFEQGGETSTLPPYNRMKQSLWNGTLRMPSRFH